MSLLASPKTRSASSAVKPYAYPLDEFYLREGVALPPIEPMRGDAVPEPYKTLLVHEQDMTPTLEAYYGTGVHLQILRSHLRGESYFREVVLRMDRNESPVEFGAIRINLSLFASPARRLILEERSPLGHILKECEVPHLSRPKAFLRVQSDSLINRALGLRKPRTLYGRRNTLTDLQQRPLAEIVEILPPAAPGFPNRSGKS